MTELRMLGWELGLWLLMCVPLALFVGQLVKPVMLELCDSIVGARFWGGFATILLAITPLALLVWTADIPAQYPLVEWLHQTFSRLLGGLLLVVLTVAWYMKRVLVLMFEQQQQQAANTQQMEQHDVGQ